MSIVFFLTAKTTSSRPSRYQQQQQTRSNYEQSRSRSNSSSSNLSRPTSVSRSYTRESSPERKEPIRFVQCFRYKQAFFKNKLPRPKFIVLDTKIYFFFFEFQLYYILRLFCKSCFRAMFRFGNL